MQPTSAPECAGVRLSRSMSSRMARLCALRSSLFAPHKSAEAWRKVCARSPQTLARVPTTFSETDIGDQHRTHARVWGSPMREAPEMRRHVRASKTVRAARGSGVRGGSGWRGGQGRMPLSLYVSLPLYPSLSAPLPPRLSLPRLSLPRLSLPRLYLPASPSHASPPRGDHITGGIIINLLHQGSWIVVFPIPLHALYHMEPLAEIRSCCCALLSLFPLLSSLSASISEH